MKKNIFVYVLSVFAIVLLGYLEITSQSLVEKYAVLFAGEVFTFILGLKVCNDLDESNFNQLQRTIKKLCDENYNLARENEELKGLNK